MCLSIFSLCQKYFCKSKTLFCSIFFVQRLRANKKYFIFSLRKKIRSAAAFVSSLNVLTSQNSRLFTLTSVTTQQTHTMHHFPIFSLYHTFSYFICPMNLIKYRMCSKCFRTRTHNNISERNEARRKKNCRNNSLAFAKSNPTEMNISVQFIWSWKEWPLPSNNIYCLLWLRIFCMPFLLVLSHLF